jgi:hypothetical protein
MNLIPPVPSPDLNPSPSRGEALALKPVFIVSLPLVGGIKGGGGPHARRVEQSPLRGAPWRKLGRGFNT